MKLQNDLTTRETYIMKPRFLWVAVLASAAMIAQAKAGHSHGGGKGGVHAGGAGHVAAVAPARAGGFSSEPSYDARRRRTDDFCNAFTVIDWVSSALHPFKSRGAYAFTSIHCRKYQST